MKLEYTHPSPSVLSIALLFILFSLVIVIPSIQFEKLQTDWDVTIAGAEEAFHTGQTIDFHLFLADENGLAIEEATVTAIFDRVETVHQIEKRFHGLQNGLYETEVVFSVPGTWIVMIDVKKGRSYYRNQYLFNVKGPIVAKRNRDPDDHFNLEQPLPRELQRELDNIPVFKR